ncbi:MAG: helicase C-terminal domain-containing protein [Gammaproteobacteria bacterium]|nr:helicase C-terminal domain-containing protein [Gammaproteobacteria bacterium]
MLKLAVTALAEFVHRRGDLHARLDGRTRADEGIALQRLLQTGRPDSYERERAVGLETELAGMPVTVAGRIDGCDAAGDVILIEEFKTTRADPEAAHRHHASVHWAQAQLYAGLLARQLGDGRGFELRLVYGHPDSRETRSFTRACSAADARQFVDETLTAYGWWLEHLADHQQARDAHLATLAFPFADYRPFQRAMARRVFQALRDREHLLLEAPTGSGKTLATVYPAVRALQAAGYRRVLFLTSRNTGAMAVRDAAAQLDPEQRFLRHASITARERACFVPGTPCEPDACPYARGYYDRARPAVVELLERRGADPASVAEVARAHTVCPFELALDAAVWSDLVVADYNYVFDPLVRLQRFANDSQAVLLVDESHQLAPRVRDMLSLVLTRREIREALADNPPDAVARRIRGLDRALLALKRRAGLAAEQMMDRPDALIRAMQRFVDEVGTGAEPLEPYPATRELLFNCSRWLRAESWYDPDRFVFLGEAAGRSVTVRLVCLDPGPYIRARLDEYGGHVRFSGTVSPLNLYARLHGEADAPAERAGNPFSAGQLGVLVVRDVPTYLRRRADSVATLVSLIDSVRGARAGHYLAAFPSFDYLQLAADAFAERFPGAALRCQTPGMSEAERGAFLAGFHDGAEPSLGFVVLGGVFGESVDFTGASLAGVICVGVGLPPPSLTRQALAEHYIGEGLDGRLVAYQQPAMVKVLQMAGRLLRSPADRGVLCLVDERFCEPAFRQFFPDHWQPRTVRAAEVAGELAAFWS